MALVETRDLVKKFGDLTAVDHISFTVGRGEVVGFLGPNGAGKSTLLQVCAGYIHPTRGTATILGDTLGATDVRELASVEDPYGPDIGDHVTDILTEADVLVPCWGDTSKVPPKLRDAFDVLMDALVSSGKPVMHFGRTKAGDPLHPLMLGYATPLTPLAD